MISIAVEKQITMLLCGSPALSFRFFNFTNSKKLR